MVKLEFNFNHQFADYYYYFLFDCTKSYGCLHMHWVAICNWMLNSQYGGAWHTGPYAIQYTSTPTHVHDSYYFRSLGANMGLGQQPKNFLYPLLFFTAQQKLMWSGFTAPYSHRANGNNRSHEHLGQLAQVVSQPHLQPTTSLGTCSTLQLADLPDAPSARLPLPFPISPVTLF